mgnify:CR=1 FL=1
MDYDPMRELPAKAGWGAGDVLVVFGELFGRGYANGIVDEARRGPAGDDPHDRRRRHGRGVPQYRERE